jgi:hypothetical protein
MINNPYGTYFIPTMGIPVAYLGLSTYCKEIESELNLLRKQCQKLA